MKAEWYNLSRTYSKIFAGLAHRHKTTKLYNILHHRYIIVVSYNHYYIILYTAEDDVRIQFDGC